MFFKAKKTAVESERALALLALDKGKKRAEVAEIFEVHIDTLDGWQTAFKRRGITEIANKGYPGNHYKITKAQKEEIKETISKKNPQELGLSEKRFWSVKLLRQYIH